MILLTACIIVFLIFLFGIAYLAENSLIPKKLIHSPLVYTLSLGSYAGAWGLSGAFDFAQNGGYIYLAFYFGTSAFFLFSPLFLQPLFQLTNTHKLSSLADLFSFRYSSQLAGIIVTIGIFLGVLPLMAIQVEIIVETAKLINSNSSKSDFNPALIEVLCYLGIIIFTISFGTFKQSSKGYNQGLVFSLAVLSALKLLIFLIAGFIATYWVFNGPSNIENWLYHQPEKLLHLNESLSSNNARTLILIFFAAVISMPHLFHLIFNENPNNQSVRISSWAFPLYLLLLSLPVFPILWATEYLGFTLPARFSATSLGFLIQMPVLSYGVFFAVLSAMIASISVITLSISSMLMNHLILPFRTRNETHLFQNIDTIKRILIVLISALTFSLYTLNDNISTLNGFGYASYTAVFQFLPGILAVLYWPTGNRQGLLSGLLVGFTFWSLSILAPIITIDTFGLQPMLERMLNLGGESYWFLAAATSLGANMLTFGLVSIFSKTDEEQKYIAQICSQDDLGKPLRQELKVKTLEDFFTGLEREIGQSTARKIISNSLDTLNMLGDETRPFALRLLRRQIESNLSGLYGPTVARQIVTKALPYLPQNSKAKDDIQLIEHRLEKTQSNLTGLAAELDKLRLYHRNTIENLPIGICSFDQGQEILMWNSALEQLTHIPRAKSIGAKIDTLVEPWKSLFIHFIESDQSHLHKAPLQIEDQQRWYTLHKTMLHNDEQKNFNQSLLIEDVTPTALLEQELLHNERLASIGRLAAGVAHEIGNPITGIACLAQNLKYDSDSPAVNETAKEILQQTERVTRIVQSLVNFSHSGSHGKQQQFEIFDIYLCIDDAIHLLSLNDNKAKDIVNNVTEKTFVYGDTQSLLQVFINLIKNSLQAVDQDFSITIDSIVNSHSVEISITDNGSGIEKSIQQTIFDPFFTTKDPGVGTGLGLALVYSIIEEHHGNIQIESPATQHHDHGCRFTIRLPKQAEEIVSLP